MILEAKRLQEKKIKALMDQGGKIAGAKIQVVMPNGSIASVCPAGSVVWLFERGTGRGAIGDF